MSRVQFILRSVRFYARTHLGVLLGCAVSAAVLIGALAVGDSVRESLRRLALDRLGEVHVALDSGRRFIGDGLASRLADELKIDVAAALRIDGMAIHRPSNETSGGGAPASRQVNRVSVIGVDDAFFRVGRGDDRAVAPERDEVFLNTRLAAALGAKVGSEIALRVLKPDLLSRDAPLAMAKEAETVRRNVVVRRVLTDDELGRFSLKSDQRAPMNAFVDLNWLQRQLRLHVPPAAPGSGSTGGRANLIVAGPVDVAAVQAALRQTWHVTDAGLAIRIPDSTGIVQLESPRIYIDPTVAAAARAPDAVGALTYLVSSITAGKTAGAPSAKTTPYSFMTAVTPTGDRALGPVPLGMKGDEIIVNSWLAEQLAVGVGAFVTIAYAELAPDDSFVDRTRTFKVRSIVPVGGLGIERQLVPHFPGLSDVDSCADWDVGLTTDQEKLKDKANEAYWKKYRETPKAFVTLAVGQAMWGNRYGDLMAVRYPASSMNARALGDELRKRVDPTAVGLGFRDVRIEARRTVSESMDLGQLFLGMSNFLVVASLLLTSMLFVFTVEQRAREMGVLRAVGYAPGPVRGLFLGEGAVLAIAGALLGVPLGLLFARTLIWGLQHAWQRAIAEAPVTFHWTATSVGIGVAAAVVISLIAMAAAMWRQTKEPVRSLLAADIGGARSETSTRGRLRRPVFFVAAVGALVLVGWTLAAKPANPAPAFFGAGALALIAGIALISMMLARLARGGAGRLSLRALGVRSAGRRAGRGLTTAAILASGTFMVLSVMAFKEDLSGQAGVRSSGTGGFALYAESSIAVHEDLNTEPGQEAFGLGGREALTGVSYFGAKMRDGDDASCLNLNQSLTPPLVGVDPKALSSRRAFAPAEEAPALWALLDRDHGEGVVPAILGDAATAMWKLKKSVGPETGDLLDYVDERGNAFKVKLVGALPMRLSVFQGRLLVSRAQFSRLYPSEAGDRVFLIDAPAGRADAVVETLTKRMDKVGLDVAPSVDRLRSFYAVESTYLSMFVVLGGLGLLLGTVGVGVLVLRNVMERRGELAMLRSVGYSPRDIARVVMAEHRFLLIAGLATGTIAAAIAVLPTILRRDADVPLALLAAILIGTALLSALWIRLATRSALRGSLVEALRQE